MKRQNRILAALLVWAAVLIVLFAVIPPEAGDSCCSDSAVFTRGVQAAYRALQAGAPDDAMDILRKTATATGTELP